MSYTVDPLKKVGVRNTDLLSEQKSVCNSDSPKNFTSILLFTGGLTNSIKSQLTHIYIYCMYYIVSSNKVSYNKKY